MKSHSRVGSIITSLFVKVGHACMIITDDSSVTEMVSDHGLARSESYDMYTSDQMIDYCARIRADDAFLLTAHSCYYVK